jgi:hypothetical protein
MISKTSASKTHPATAPTDHVHHLRQLDLARRWCVSPRTLERWRWLGQGPAYLKLGGTIVYRLEDVEGYEAAQRRAGRPSGCASSAT